MNPVAKDMNLDATHTREWLRLQARLEAFEELKAVFEPWLMEERDASAREALSNVVFHLDAEIAEQRRRLDALGRTGPE